MTDENCWWQSRHRWFHFVLGEKMMSIQAVSNVSLFQALQNNHGRRSDLRPITSAQQIDIAGADLTNQSHGFWQQRRAGLDQLGQALLAGNADAAQQAFDALVALGQNGPLRNGETFHRADRARDFAAIGQALASGDLAGAQAALTDLASTFAHGISSGGGLPPGPPTLIPPQGGPPAPPTPIPPQGTFPPGPPMLIHPPTSVGTGPSGPPEVIGNAARSTSTSESAGANAQGANTNYQSVLNLLETASNRAAQNGSLSLQA